MKAQFNTKHWWEIPQGKNTKSIEIEEVDAERLAFRTATGNFIHMTREQAEAAIEVLQTFVNNGEIILSETTPDVWMLVGDDEFDTKTIDLTPSKNWLFTNTTTNEEVMFSKEQGRGLYEILKTVYGND